MGVGFLFCAFLGLHPSHDLTLDSCSFYNFIIIIVRRSLAFNGRAQARTPGGLRGQGQNLHPFFIVPCHVLRISTALKK